MKYICTEDGTYHLEKYFKYLETIRGKLPPNALAFATNRKYYSIYDHESLHDAWLRSINIVEIQSMDNPKIMEVEIYLHFLGPYHDVFIDIMYKKVSAYHLKGTFRFPNSKGKVFPHWDSVHGDLLIHEIRLSEEEKIYHEMEFHKGSSFIIECEDIVHQLTWQTR